MSDELTLESLDLKKPLEKMTAKELRELVIEKLPQIKGASGMDKDQLLSEIKELLGIEEEDAKTAYKEHILALKRQMKDLQNKRLQMPADNKKERTQLRKQISRLKKRTRRLAAS
ncbi:MAG: hypothetical protein ACQESV_02130 [Thermodesulfobacteriota bacterium]